VPDRLCSPTNAFGLSTGAPPGAKEPQRLTRWLSLPVAAGVTAALLVAVPVVGDSSAPAGAGGPAASAAADSADPADKDPVVEGNFKALTQFRLVDTRDGTGAPQAKLTARQTLDIQVTGRGGIPTSGVAAVAVSITTTGSSANSPLTVYPTGATRPAVTTHTAMPGENLDNIAMIKPGRDGKISVYNDAGTTDLLVSVTGYYTADETGAGFSVVNQARVADTRTGQGVRQGSIPAGSTAASSIEVSLTGAGVPTTATAAAVNLIAISSTNGFLNAGVPGDAARKLGFSYSPGTGATSKIVPIKDGKLQVINASGGTIDLLVEVQGYFGEGNSGGGYTPLAGDRIYDSRTSDGMIPANESRTIEVLGKGGIPKSRVGAATLNLTVTGQTATGGVRVDAEGLAPNPATNVNYEPGQVRTNNLITPTELPATGKIKVFNGGSSPVHVVLDADGYFAPYFDPNAGSAFPGGPGERQFSSFTDAALNDRTTARTNAVNGNLLVSVDEIDIAGRGTDLVIGRHYNSRTDAGLRDSIENDRASTNTAERGAFGPGWTFDATGDVRLPASGNNRVFHGPTGSEVTFTPRSGGGWNTPTGMTATLKTVSGGFELRMDREGETWKFTTDGRLTSMVDRNDNTTTYTADGSGRLATITDTRGRDLTLTWSTPTGSPAPVVTRIADATGRQWSYGYTDGRLTTATDPANQVVRYTYDAAGRLATIADSRGVLAVASYDANGRVTKLERPLTGSTGGPTTASTYAKGRTRVVDARGNTTTYVYDYLGRVSDVFDGRQNDQSNSYDANSNVVSYTPTTGQATGTGVTNAYSSNGKNQLTSSKSPTGASSTFEYSNNGNNDWAPTKATDANGASTTYTYDAKGNRSSTTDSAAEVGTTRVERNADGQVSAGYDAKGNVTRYGYNSRGELTTIDHPAPLGDETFTYDALSRMVTAVDGKGTTTRYGYDALDRITSIQTGSDSVNYVTYFYDTAGNQVREVDDAGDDFSSYDRHNRVITEQRAVGGEQRYTYDDVGNLTRMTSSTPGASTTTPQAWAYEYDEANNVVASVDPAGNRVTFTYDRDNQRTMSTFPGGTVQTTTRDASSRPERIRAVNGTTVLTDTAYTYTKGSSDTSLVQTRTDHAGLGGPAGSRTSYTYDGKNRLTKADERTSAGAAFAAWDYTYDKNSNRTRQTLSGSTGPGTTAGATTYTYNAADQLTAFNGSTSGWAYDAAGNETSGGAARTGVPARTNEYNRLNQTTATIATGVRNSFTYSGADNTQRVRASGTTFTQSALGLIGTSTTSGTNSYVTRDPSGQLISTTTAGVTQYFLTDNLGSVIALVDGAGSRTATYSYDPYGTTRTTTGANAGANPYRYTGAYLDAQSGLYKLGLRYMDPTIGRFTQTDPTRKEENNYLYVEANPCNATDRTGAETDYLEACGIGGLTGMAGGAFAGAFTGPGGAVAGGLIGGVGGCAVGVIDKWASDTADED